jgi:hypothetical protein
MAALTTAGCLLVGVSGGLFAFRLRLEATYQRGLLAGQHQAEQAHSDWHPVLSADAWNKPDPPRGRHRSPDRKAAKPVAPQPIRPVLYDR